MTSIVIGTQGGLAIDVPEVLGALGDIRGRDLTTDERCVVGDHVERVLYGSANLVLLGGGLERRIGEGRYLAVGDLSRLGLAVVVGPFIHAVGIAGALKGASRLITFDRRWRPHVVALYAQLEGEERDAFEVVHSLQNDWIVVNYDALADGDFATAYGQRAPTADEIVTRAGVDLRDALARLTERHILVCNEARYSIRF